MGEIIEPCDVSFFGVGLCVPDNSESEGWFTAAANISSTTSSAFPDARGGRRGGWRMDFASPVSISCCSKGQNPRSSEDLAKVDQQLIKIRNNIRCQVRLFSTVVQNNTCKLSGKSTLATSSVPEELWSLVDSDTLLPVNRTAFVSEFKQLRWDKTSATHSSFTLHIGWHNCSWEVRTPLSSSATDNQRFLLTYVTCRPNRVCSRILRLH